MNNLLERTPELLVPDGVDDRIDERVGVAEPQADAEHRPSDAIGAIAAERRERGEDEEWHPADQKAADDDAKRARRAAQALAIAARERCCLRGGGGGGGGVCRWPT